jgi:hypothetical protein
LVAADENAENQVTQLSKLLEISDQISSLSGRALSAAPQNSPHDVISLGDTSEEDTPRSTGTDLMTLAVLINKLSQSENLLGEGSKITTVDAAKLHRLMKVSSDEDNDAAIRRVLSYLEKQVQQGARLTTSELNKLRSFYISRTAMVLARFGYEDSDFGKHDVSARRGDALAARKHMEEEDINLRIHKTSGKKAQAEAAITSILRYLQETTHLADYLDKVVDARIGIEKASKHKLQSASDTKLQADEMKIEEGVDDLLAAIKSMQPSKHGHTQKKAPKKVSRVPLPRIEKELRRDISKQLAKVHQHLGAMQKNQQPLKDIDKAELQHYLQQITADLLHSYLTYEDWTDKEAIKHETDAIKSGDAEAPSRIQGGQIMSQKQIVEHFLATTWKSPNRKSVPNTVAAFAMNQEIALPSGGHVIIVGGLH